MACTKIRMQSLPKWQNIEVANVQFPVCFETVFCVSRTLCILLMRGFDALPSICVICYLLFYVCDLVFS